MPTYLSCPLCVKNTLADVQELQTRIASVLGRILHCPICSASLQGLPSLHFHLATHIPIQGNEFQGTRASQEQILPLEKLEISDIRDSSNPSSNKTYEQNSPSTFVASGSSSKGEETCAQAKSIHFNCEFCGLVFSSEYFLTLHKDIMHSDANEFEVECKQCKCRFPNLEAYRDHVKEVHSDRRYICDHCPKSFKIKGGLLVHTRMFHDQNFPSTCQVCKKKFTSKARKELHERRYHDKTRTNLTQKSSTAQSPKLNKNLHQNSGEPQCCLETIVQEKGLQNSPNSFQTVQDSTSADTENSTIHLNDIQTRNNSPKLIKYTSRNLNNQNKSKKSPDSVRHSTSSCLSTFVPSSNYTVNNQLYDLAQKSDEWKKEAIKNSEKFQQGEQIFENQQYNHPTFTASSDISPPFQLAYSIPNYGDLKIEEVGSLFSLSPLVPSRSLNGQVFLQNFPHRGTLPELNNRNNEMIKYIQHCPNSPKLPNHFQTETKNIYSSLSSPPPLPNEITNSGKPMPQSTVSTNIPNSTTVKIPKDYTITLPPNVNMNISCLVNTINSPTNIINKMSNSLGNPPQVPLLPEAETYPNRKTKLSEASENKQEYSTKEDTIKPKVNIKKVL